MQYQRNMRESGIIVPHQRNYFMTMLYLVANNTRTM